MPARLSKFMDDEKGSPEAVAQEKIDDLGHNGAACGS